MTILALGRTYLGTISYLVSAGREHPSRVWNHFSRVARTREVAVVRMLCTTTWRSHPRERRPRRPRYQNSEYRAVLEKEIEYFVRWNNNAFKNNSYYNYVKKLILLHHFNHIISHCSHAYAGFKIKFKKLLTYYIYAVSNSLIFLLTYIIRISFIWKWHVTIQFSLQT